MTLSQNVAPGGGFPPAHGLYSPDQERDSCGVGFIAHIKGLSSHQIILDAEHLLCRMDHRGARGSDANSGDGAGILTALPHTFLARVAQDDLGTELPNPGEFAAGVVFLPTDEAEKDKCKQSMARICAEEGQSLVGWRIVPTRPDEADLGPTAKAAAPRLPPASPAAGWTNNASKGPSRMIRPLATQLSATPPAIQRARSPVI